MNIETLKYFLEVEKHNSFSMAAEELCISQSSLSKHIKKLEKELNCKLFDRSTRNVRLTNEGTKVKEYGERIIDNHHRLISDLQQYSLKGPRLSIGYIPVINQYNIATKIGEFKKNHPKLNITFQEGEHQEILNLLISKKIDFAILRSDNLDINNLNITSLSEDELVIIMPKIHPLSQKKYISLKDLSDEKFISLGKNSGVYYSFLKHCREVGFEPNVICFNSRIENIIGLVAAGMGVSPIMKKTVECFNRNNIATILLKEKIYSNLCLIHLEDKELNDIEKTFKSYLQNGNV